MNYTTIQYNTTYYNTTLYDIRTPAPARDSPQNLSGHDAGFVAEEVADCRK